jgi:hypothetical protein
VPQSECDPRENPLLEFGRPLFIVSSLSVSFGPEMVARIDSTLIAVGKFI